MAATSEEFHMHGFEIQTYLFLFYMQRINYLEKKRWQPKDRKITLESDNKISKIWAFYFKIRQNETREMLACQNVQLNAQFCLQYI